MQTFRQNGLNAYLFIQISECYEPNNVLGAKNISGIINFLNSSHYGAYIQVGGDRQIQFKK